MEHSLESIRYAVKMKEKEFAHIVQLWSVTRRIAEANFRNFAELLTAQGSCANKSKPLEICRLSG